MANDSSNFSAATTGGRVLGGLRALFALVPVAVAFSDLIDIGREAFVLFLLEFRIFSKKGSSASPILPSAKVAARINVNVNALILMI
jgi:hypothetical protein